MNILISRMADKHTHETFFPQEVMDDLSSCGKVTEGVYTREALLQALPGQEVLFAGWGIPKLDAELLSHADALKLVLYTGGSVADFITEELYARGVRLCSGNRLYADSVAEGTIGYMLLAQRRLMKIVNETAEKGWAEPYYTDGIRFKTVGLIGFGMIAKSLAKMLPVFGCKVKICSPYYLPEDVPVYGAESCTMEELFSTCDIVSLHESLREDTYHMIDRRYFSMMKPDALFVNTARGPILVEADLAEAAKAGRIRAVLDVYEKEPLPMDSCLRGCENIILVPHRGGPTIDVRAEVTKALIGDLRRFQADEHAALIHEIPWDYAKNMTQSKFLRK